MDTKNNILGITPAEGQVLSIAGGSYRIVISGAQTNGEFAVIEMSVPPNAGPIPHAHADIHETFYVLAGEVVFNTDGGSFLAQTGAFINIPKGGAIHNFKNTSAQPAKLLCTVYPAGMDVMFAESAAYFAPKSQRERDGQKKIHGAVGREIRHDAAPDA